ncbi:MAG: hypothetical protein JO323_01650 [Acidobacteriia bacterium]|nr:hypothetical protein [Terriglobia bacterium]
MIRRSFALAVIVGTLIAAGQPGTKERIATSARNFEQRFEELKGAGNALSPLERVLFSLALAGANAR